MPVCLLALCWATLFTQQVSAQTNEARLMQANRWLVIVDTARPMERRAETVKQVVASLVVYGMRGQMQPGDSLGVWTFNDNLYAGTFPLQRWTPETSKTIAMRILDFLHTQDYGKNSRLEKVIPGVQQISKDAEFLTVVVISDGRNEIRGTPFDDQINQSYRSWQKEQQKSLMPFVTLLRASKGQFTEYAVTTPPWPLEIPALPENRIRAPVAAAPAVIKAKAPPPVMGPPLIITGKKPEPIQPEESSTTTAPASPAVTGETPDLKVAAKPVAEPAPAPAPNSGGPADPPAEPPQTGSPEVRPVETPHTATAQTSNPELPAKPDDAADDSAELATATPSQTLFSPKNIGIISGVLAVVLLALLFLGKRRSRPVHRISLITRSMDRERE